jgi:hypothetical protein
MSRFAASGRLARSGFLWAIPLLLLGSAACSKESPETTALVAREPGRSVAAPASPPAVPHSAAPASLPPPTFLFVGESWSGPVGIFALQDPVTKASSWYQVGEKNGPYEIAGSRNGQLLVKANGQEFTVALRGISLQSTSSAPSVDAPSITQNGPSTIKVWLNGVGVEAAPAQMSPELLRIYTESKEALLRAEVPADLKPMIAQALEATTVVHSDAKSGLRRADLPPEVSAKMSDELIEKINAAVQKDPAVRNASGAK